MSKVNSLFRSYLLMKQFTKSFSNLARKEWKMALRADFSCENEIRSLPRKYSCPYRLWCPYLRFCPLPFVFR